MSHWGAKSYENDEAVEALDAGFDRVHGPHYEELMADENPLTVDQIETQLANAETLSKAVEALVESVGRPFDGWDEVERLAFAGVVVRHAELGVAIPEEWRARALDWLEHEEIEWEEATARRLRRQKEMALLGPRTGG